MGTGLRGGALVADPSNRAEGARTVTSAIGVVPCGALNGHGCALWAVVVERADITCHKDNIFTCREL